VQAVHQRAVPPAQVVRLGRQAQLGEPAEQPADGDLSLEPGQRRAEAVVNAVPEREVAGACPGDVEAVGVGEAAPVPVRWRR